MKRLVPIILFFVCSELFAANQLPDLFIMGKDTIEIYQLPLEAYLKKNPSNYLNKLREDTTRYAALACARGYRATWRLENNDLYLVNIVDCSEEEQAAAFLKKIFKEHYKDGKVRADWFSSYLTAPRGKMLRDNASGTAYEKELKLNFKDGVLTDQQTVENYVDLENGLARYKEDEIKQVLLKEVNRLDWNVLGPAMCDDEYVVTIDEKGKISDVVPTPTFESGWDNYRMGNEMKKCAKALKKAFKELQFDILKWNGNPYREHLKVRFYYNADTGKVESVL